MQAIQQYLKEIIFLLEKDIAKIPILLFTFFILAIIDIAGIGLVGTYIALLSQPKFFENSWFNNWLVKFDLNLAFFDIIIFMGIGLFLLFTFKAIIGILIQYYNIRFVNNHNAKI